MTGRATLIRALSGFRGEAALYRLDPPMDRDGHPVEWAVVSAAVVPYSGPETYIFEADSTGAVVDWGELPGSSKGTLQHAEALDEAGYTVTEAE